ncbi:hypothetical protein GGER_24810 [Serratia rubidaea]
MDAVTNAGRPAVDRGLQPEFRVVAAVTDGAMVLQHATAAQGGQHPVIKIRRLVKMVGPDGDVGQTGGNVHR